MKRICISLAMLLALGTTAAFADSAHHKAEGKNPSAQVTAPKDQSKETSGTVTINGHEIRYKAVAGIMILKKHDGKPFASMSYVA